MRYFLLSIILLAGMVVVVSPTVRSQSDSKKQATPTDEQKPEKGEKKRAADRSADEAAIRANVAAFVKAYNARDAKAVAAMFTQDGLIVDKEGDASEGRDAIQKVFAGLFAESPKKQIEVTIESIRFVGADLAMEEGTTKETAAPGEIPEYDRYTVLHVKRDGKWLMAMARDEEGPPPSSHEQLRPLAWLVGEWVDDGGSVVVNSTCRWSEDGNFLLQEFNIQVGGKNAMRVSQRIGWDPQAKRIRSWVFDSDGGFGESVWTHDQDDDLWVIKATGVRPDGSNASSTNVLVPDGKDAYVWRSRDRIVGDEVAPPVEVKVVRKPPQPKK
jgi:uncharacterized protein (TIGR02246 family)